MRFVQLPDRGLLRLKLGGLLPHPLRMRAKLIVVFVPLVLQAGRQFFQSLLVCQQVGSIVFESCLRLSQCLGLFFVRFLLLPE